MLGDKAFKSFLFELAKTEEGANQVDWFEEQYLCGLWRNVNFWKDRESEAYKEFEIGTFEYLLVSIIFIFLIWIGMSCV